MPPDVTAILNGLLQTTYRLASEGLALAPITFLAERRSKAITPVVLSLSDSVPEHRLAELMAEAIARARPDMAITIREGEAALDVTVECREGVWRGLAYLAPVVREGVARTVGPLNLRPADLPRLLP